MERRMLEVFCGNEGGHLVLDEKGLEGGYCEYDGFCPVRNLKMRVRVVGGMLARAVCVCGSDNAGLVRYYEETKP